MPKIKFNSHRSFDSRDANYKSFREIFKYRIPLSVIEVDFMSRNAFNVGNNFDIKLKPDFGLSSQKKKRKTLTPA